MPKPKYKVWLKVEIERQNLDNGGDAEEYTNIVTSGPLSMSTSSPKFNEALQVFFQILSVNPDIYKEDPDFTEEQMTNKETEAFEKALKQWGGFK